MAAVTTRLSAFYRVWPRRGQAIGWAPGRANRHRHTAVTERLIALLPCLAPLPLGPALWSSAALRARHGRSRSLLCASYCRPSVALTPLLPRCCVAGRAWAVALGCCAHVPSRRAQPVPRKPTTFTYVTTSRVTCGCCTLCRCACTVAVSSSYRLVGLSLPFPRARRFALAARSRTRPGGPIE